MLLRWCSNGWFQPIRISDTYLYRAKCNGNVISVSGSKYFTSLHLPHYISNVITFATILVGSPPDVLAGGSPMRFVSWYIYQISQQIYRRFFDCGAKFWKTCLRFIGKINMAPYMYNIKQAGYIFLLLVQCQTPSAFSTEAHQLDIWICYLARIWHIRRFFGILKVRF